MYEEKEKKARLCTTLTVHEENAAWVAWQERDDGEVAPVAAGDDDSGAAWVA